MAAQNPQMPVITLTMYVEDEHVIEAIKAGARGYVLKSTRGGELIEMIRTVSQGGSVLDPGAVKTLLEEFRRLADDLKE